MQADAERSRPMRLIYVTSQLPFGSGEPFIVPEIVSLEQQGCDVTVVPVRRSGTLVHGDAARLLAKAVARPLASPSILWAALAETTRAPRKTMRALLPLRGSRNTRILLKNLAVFPKALWLARYARRADTDHLHAHWAGTSATLAMLAAEISGIPWSFTAHRWDIAEDNLLALKVRHSCFVRAISAHGGQELAAIVGCPEWSPWVLHMGVELPQLAPRKQTVAGPLRVLTAARFVEKKGHVYLIDAVRRLKERGVSVRVELAGDGPLAGSLKQAVRDLRLEDDVVFVGKLAHEKLLSAMADGRWDVVVLPSVVTASGELEGIPVSLIEAMACGLPTIATESGGIPELLGGGAGILVSPADPESIAQALTTLAEDRALRAELAQRGRKRVEQAFSSDAVAAALHSRMRGCLRNSTGARRL